MDGTEKGTAADCCPTCGRFSDEHDAQSRERARLARELHDSVVQQVFSMRMHAKALRAQAEPGHVDPDQVRSAADELLGLAKTTLTDLRSLVLRLHPAELTGRGLADAVSAHAESVHAASGLLIEVDAGELPEQPDELKEDLYRIVQEALHNVVKHAGATRVTIRLKWTDTGELTMEIGDDGAGFRRERAGGLGLTSMKERARRWGGSMEIGNGGQGCRVVVRVPAQAVPPVSQPGGAIPR